MFGVKKLRLSNLPGDDLKRLAGIVMMVAQWRSEGNSNERLTLGRLAYTMDYVLKDVREGKTPELTRKTTSDLRATAQFFFEEIDGVTERSAPLTSDPEGALAAGATIREASGRIVRALDVVLTQAK